jgi:hypothetical protein
VIPAFLLAALAVAKPTAREAPRPLEEKMTPALPFAPLRGWLGFAVRPRTDRALPYTPDHPHATLVSIDPAGWDEIEEGTAFYATASGETLSLVYSELSRIPFGCDDVPTRMVAFTGPYEPGEELFWVSDAPGARPIPIRAGATTPDTRSWTLGDLTFTVERTGETSGRATLRDADRVGWKAEWAKPDMEGVEKTAADLANPLDTAVPVPVAAWVLPGEQPVVVIRSVGYEGVTFEVLRRDGKSWTSAGRQYVYVCAV